MLNFMILLLLSMTASAGPLDGLKLPEKISTFYNKSSKEDMSLVEEFYHPEAEFIDPIGSIKGAPKLKAYYAHLYENVTAIKFEFSQFYQQDKTVVAIWTMRLRTKSLKDGEEVSVDGTSVITFDDAGKAIRHRDYFDLGEMVYEHIPVLGFLVRKVKDRLKHKD